MSGFDTTRFAVIADTHGNADALKAVLSDIDRLGISDIVNLGDHFSGPLAAGETAAILRARPMICVRGNHDRWLCDQKPEEMAPSDAAACADLRADDIDWLRAQPPHVHVTDNVFACHATPQDDLTYWLERVLPDGTVAQRPLQEVINLAANTGASLMLCAHTHIPRRVDLPDGRVILNPGSVGCPAFDDSEPVYHIVETGTPAACYAVVERTDIGWQSEFRHVPYETSRMAGRAMAAGRPGWACAVSTGWYRMDDDAEA